MIINCPKFNPKEITFQKINAVKSNTAYDENKEFYIEGNDVSVSPAKQQELFETATISKEKLGGLTKRDKDKYYAARKLIDILVIISNYSTCLIAINQLRTLYKMRKGQEISQKKIGDALKELLDYGFIEKCCIKTSEQENPTTVLYKMSNRGAELIVKYCQRELALEKGRNIPMFTVEDLPEAWKAQENYQLCQIVTEMFKNNFAASVFFNTKYDTDSKSTKILSFANIGKSKTGFKKLYLFAPRRQPGWEDYLKAALKEFASRFENANEVPKLLLSCEDANHLYLVHYIVEEMDLGIDVVYTEDIAPIVDFRNAFSWFDKDGAEIQLIPN